MCKNCNVLCLVSESNKQNPRDRSLDLPFFFRYKDLPSFKKLPFARTKREFAVLVSGQLCGFVCLKFLIFA